MNEAVEENFRHIRNLAKNIENLLGGESTTEQQLSNEFAGMFAVTIAATYEGIVKETLIAYAATFHQKYKEHMEKDFDRLNARISIDDLRAYSRRFGLSEWTGHGIKKNSTTFHKILSETQVRVERRFRKDLIKSYENIFTWRHAYAHERSTLATFKDVYEAHRVAQYVIRSFVKAFEVG
jgi:RiboL-PSP-HEPN